MNKGVTKAAASAIALASTLLAACSNTATESGTPTESGNPTDFVLRVVAGDSQVGLAYEELPDPIVVRVVDARDDSPVEGQIVNFRVVEGDGSVYGGAAQTDAQGLALDYWTLGAPGPQRIEARAVSSDGEKLVFGSLTATALAPLDSIPAAIQCADSTGAWVFDGSCGRGPTPVRSTIPLRFRVVNADTLAIPNVQIRFSVWASVPDSSNHSGTVVPSEATTDSAGTVGVVWTLDSLRGMYALDAMVERPDRRRLHHSLEVLAYEPDAAPAAVQCWGPSDTWRYGGACDYPAQPVRSTIAITFRVVDDLGLPIADVPVLFRVDTTGGGTGLQDGSVTPDSALTDSLGTTTALWTLGQYAGNNRLVAIVLAGTAAPVGVTVVGLGDSTVPSVVWWTNPAGGSWHDSANWDLGRVPGQRDTVDITLPGTFTVTVSDTAAIYMLELGASDSSARTLLIDGTTFQLYRTGVVRTGGTFSVVDAEAVGGSAGINLLIQGGAARMDNSAWRLHTRMESGTFVFEGSSPNVMGPAVFLATGGDVIWRNADTLLLLVDSTSIVTQDATFTLETRAVLNPSSAATLPHWFGDLRFFADSLESTSLTVYSTHTNVNGTVSIVERTAVAGGTVFDVIRLENGATLSGSPTMGTPGYTLTVNPEAGVGLRVVKN